MRGSLTVVKEAHSFDANTLLKTFSVHLLFRPPAYEVDPNYGSSCGPVSQWERDYKQ